MNGDEEEDCEVVLKNSELYKYLLNCEAKDFDVYEKSIVTEEKGLHENAIRKPITRVSSELLIYLDAILNCNVLLDEDVTFLYGYTVDLISDLKVKKFWDIALCSILGLCTLVTAVRHNFLIKADYFVKSASDLKRYYIKWHRKKLLNHLIITVKQIHLYFKKTLQVLYEQNAYFKLQELKFKSNGKIDEKDIDVLTKKKKAEVDSLSVILCQCIVDNIIKTRDHTRTLIHQLPLISVIDSKEHYLAYMSYSQLGIQNYTSALDSTSVSSLDALKNVYLLMQSEFFRRLGLCFCPTIWSSKISFDMLSVCFEIIQNYSKSCEDTLSVIQFYYKKHIFPDYLSTHRPKDSVLVSSYSVIHKISTSLNELVMDSRILEEYIEILKKFDDSDVDSVCCRLEELRKGLENSVENVYLAEKFFSKLRKHKEIKKEPNEGNDCTMTTEKVPVTVEIGKFSRSMDSKDHVYFTITEGKINNYQIQESDDFEPVKLPNFLLSELKEALLEKRNEFDDRENKAVEDPEEYKKFLDTPEMKFNETKKENLEESIRDITISEFQMQKMVASAVAQRSVQFIKQAEEQFGSSDESDNES